MLKPHKTLAWLPSSPRRASEGAGLQLGSGGAGTTRAPSPLPTLLLFRHPEKWCLLLSLWTPSLPRWNLSYTEGLPRWAESVTPQSELSPAHAVPPCCREARPLPTTLASGVPLPTRPQAAITQEDESSMNRALSPVPFTLPHRSCGEDDRTRDGLVGVTRLASGGSRTGLQIPMDQALSQAREIGERAQGLRNPPRTGPPHAQCDLSWGPMDPRAGQQCLPRRPPLGSLGTYCSSL